MGADLNEPALRRTAPSPASSPAEAGFGAARKPGAARARRAAATEGERMSRVDTAWLRMDNDVNLMVIVGVWLLDRPLSIGALRERIAAKLLQYDRFRQKVVVDTLGARWVDDDDFDLAHHMTLALLEVLPGQSERQALQRLCGELAMTPLDRSRPLWQFHLVEHYEGGSALVVRIHHCIGDGIALISVMQSITDGGSDPPRRRRRQKQDGIDAEFDWLADAVLRPLTDLAVKAISMSGSGVARSIEALGQRSFDGSVGAARTGVKVVNDVAALALMADDAPTRLKGRGSGHKVVAWSEPLPLNDIKTVGKALGCTVNDVLLACATGAIGDWLAAEGDDPAGKEIRAMVPVNLRPLEQAWQLGNRFGLAPLVLPIGIANPVARVYDVRRRMAQLKGSWQPLLAYGVLAASGLFVKPLQDAVLGLFSKKATAVMTNVPGPAVPLKMCGATLRQNLFWVPASGHIGVGLSILSYGGGVQFGLITDRALCPQPQAIVDRFGPEFEALLHLTLMLPWPGQADFDNNDTGATPP